MAIKDIINLHVSAVDRTSTETLMQQIEQIVQPYLHNLSEEENNKFGFIKEKNKLFVNKVKDYRESQPALSSNDVNWTEFMADYDDRRFFELGALRLQALAAAMLETKRLYDYDNFQNASLDYKYSIYKNETEPGLGYDTKVNELKQFFDKGPGDKPDEPSPVPPGPVIP